MAVVVVAVVVVEVEVEVEVRETVVVVVVVEMEAEEEVVGGRRCPNRLRRANAGWRFRCVYGVYWAGRWRRRIGVGAIP